MSVTTETPAVTPPPPTVLRRARELAPGSTVVAAVTATGLLVNHLLPMLSPLSVAIVLGVLMANTVAVPVGWEPGLRFSSKRLLRVGVALLGLQVTFGDVLGLGPAVLAVVVTIVAAGIGGTLLMGRALGVGRTQRLLIACGFSICGAAAAAAVGEVTDADEEELVTTVALVVVFGTLLIAALPVASRALGLAPHTAGVWAGGAVHEVAQVVATGSALGGGALTVAVIVKLARVILLAPVLAVIGRRTRRRDGDARRIPLIPLFVVAFLACAALRTTGVLPSPLLAAAKPVQTALLTAAMFALGAGVRISALRRVGPRPLVLAALATAWVTGLALVGAVLTAG
ncbi:YeiH family protein [Nocardia sp. alder85J]|uniref:YeiH family protein n=1 Tax=Nocardia sp. alder85J TaxID=2862949 RepID=UPI001CD6E80E|nr:putative sulfate exporter family transporter [Nocardia sp. alder85J]MCX4091238.1 putative sulfate exporter family transporter [Nocardia sp. alder85J]